ncbi:pantothenate kinase 1-like [Phalaenopsis equestris]|uniref:pantothenate kinase 1-like n=1 Tax=Phalaenopsis equestris TaxID=78828 RepID=UPI0009E5AB53|nr:pantothenate kinase 1-like [Phalaenopsis equestris]
MNYKGLLNLKGAEICGDLEERNPPISLPNQSSDCALLAVDIGGTLIKLVYFEDNAEVKNHGMALGGHLKFMKFQTSRLDECLEFIRSKRLLYGRGFAAGSTIMNVDMKATGGGSFKFADIFKEKLGVSLDKLDEMDTVVTGANFLLKKIPYESFTFMHGKRTPVDVDQKNLFPYLLVNIGSGVSMIKVMGNRKFERVTGTHIGGGTMFGLAKLLTGCTRYDEFLKLSQQGDNLVLDLIVKDICGELVCQKQGLSASTLASSFGKVLSSRRKLSDYKAEDLATTLLSAFTYNIAQVSFLVASLLRLNRVYFGGSYIRGHASTMDNISYAIDFWSKGQMHAIFLRHEGFLGALGALLNYENLKSDDLILEDSKESQFHDDSFKADDDKLTTELSEDSLFPYLLVNIGSGVSMIEVIGKGKFERIIGTHLGGGTILGLARLLTGCLSYDDFLELSQRGDNLSVDLTVGDIYGEHGYPKIGLPATTTASSFGKVTSNKLSDYKAEDFAAALLNAFTYNIGQISYFVAKLSGLKKIFFRGTYICGHAKTMDKISRALKYWSKGEVQITFLCHEGFMGTFGAFWSYENMGIHDLAANDFIKEVLLSAPYMLGKAQVSPTMNLNMKSKSSLSEEVKRLKQENIELAAELERLKQENIDLKSTLSKLQNSSEALQEHEDMYTFTADKGQ